MNLEQIIETYNDLRSQACLIAKAEPELMGKEAWLKHALWETDITLDFTASGVRCYGNTFSMQTQDREDFDFIIPISKFNLEGAAHAMLGA